VANFSQRLGFKPTEMPFQLEDVDEALRTKIWNILNQNIWSYYVYGNSTEASQRTRRFALNMWANHLGKDIDNFPNHFRHQPVRTAVNGYDILKRYFFNCHWAEVFDFIEFVVQKWYRSEALKGKINDALSNHNSAYRIIGTEVAAINSATEVDAIEDALRNTSKSVQSHLESSLSKLSDRVEPDYRNSIKEAISAVEAACRELAGKDNATLSDALKKIPHVHPGMNRAFIQLYGYTNDQSGVRHALKDAAEEVTKADAHFMLVACAAFVSYLQASRPA